MLRGDRSVKTLLTLLVAGVWGLLIQTLLPAQPALAQDGGEAKAADVIRARRVVIVDEKGRDRIVLGSPMPDPKGVAKRISASTGIQINDPDGYERFGLGLDEKGIIGMGFDAPHPKDGKNPERINIAVDPQGGAVIRFLNRETWVSAMLRLAQDNKVYLEFWDVQADSNKIVKRIFSVKGEEQKESRLR